MWHRPQLMSAIADLLLLGGSAALLYALVLWAARLPVVPLHEVVLLEAPAKTGRSDLERVVAASLRGNFFSVNLEAFRSALEQLPWVRRADVRRSWPGRVEIRLEEHRAVARWGEGSAQLVNSHGEVFYATGATDPAAMPVLSGPPGSAPEVLRRHGDFTRALAAIGRRPQQLTLSPRLAWQLKLDDGMLLELGREQAKAPIGERLGRFAAVYPQLVAERGLRPQAVDLRYPNGFALRAATAAAASDTRGKS